MPFGIGTWIEIRRPRICGFMTGRNNTFFRFGNLSEHIWISPIMLPLTPNDLYISRTTPLTSKRCNLYIYSTNVGTEYFKHALCSPFFFSSKWSFFHNSNFFGSCIIHILYTECTEIKKKNNSGAKGLKRVEVKLREYVCVCVCLCEAKLSPLSSSGTENAWTNTFVVLCLIKHRQ